MSERENNWNAKRKRVHSFKARSAIKIKIRMCLWRAAKCTRLRFAFQTAFESQF